MSQKKHDDDDEIENGGGRNHKRNDITDACSTPDCYPLLTICPRCCPRHAPDDVIIHCGFPQDFPKVFPRFPRDFPKIFPRFPWDFLKTPGFQKYST